MKILNYSPDRIVYKLRGRKSVVERSAVLPVEDLPYLNNHTMSIGQIV